MARHRAFGLAWTLFVSLLWGPLAAQTVGSKECAACHRAIYDSYQRTPMAASSGAIGEGLIKETFDRAAFTHAASGFDYRVRSASGKLSIEFARKNGMLEGRVAMPYFVGSGATARSYLLQEDGYLYEAPVAYYAAGRKWDLAPAYERYAYPYLTRPVTPGCLNCHSSFLAVEAGKQNRYVMEPFAEGGIACERCHGSGAAHIARMKAGRNKEGPSILNPAKLDPDRRDSICSQCHLSGEVRVFAPRKNWDSFRPGDRLTESSTVFVKFGATAGITVTGHVEKLAQSACKRRSGDRLWCGSCHDPHAVPKPAERVAWFRQKCLGCHQASDCKESRPERDKARDDCTGCHMPKNTAVDAQHVVYTDHSIPRRPRLATPASRADAELVAFNGAKPSPRDLALAYAIVASRERTPAYQSRARTLLEQAERASPDDAEVLQYLAELYRNGEEAEKAIPLYERAIRLDPAQVTASVGLGGIRMERGQYAEAIRLWEDALSKNAGLELVRVNLAMAYWRSGNLTAAEAHLLKAVSLSPGFAPATDLLRQLRQR